MVIARKKGIFYCFKKENIYLGPDRIAVRLGKACKVILPEIVGIL